MILNSRAELQLSLLQKGIAETAVDQWVKRLRQVPDVRLDECYQAAMDAHVNRSALVPKEILDQWHILRQLDTTARGGIDHEKTCPYWCSQAGWITVDASDTVQLGGSKSPDYTYAKPCPHHRPQGFKRDEHAAPFCAGEWPRLPRAESSHVGHLKQNPSSGSAADWKNAGQVAAQLDIPDPRDDEHDEPIH